MQHGLTMDVMICGYMNICSGQSPGQFISGKSAEVYTPSSPAKKEATHLHSSSGSRSRELFLARLQQHCKEELGMATGIYLKPYRVTTNNAKQPRLLLLVSAWPIVCVHF